MDRENIRTEIRATLPVELSDFSDTYLDNLINRGMQAIGRFYPFPVNIVDLSTDGSEPAFAEEFHWLVVDWVVAMLYRNAGQSEPATIHIQLFREGIREMAKFYTGGRT